MMCSRVNTKIVTIEVINITFRMTCLFSVFRYRNPNIKKNGYVNLLNIFSTLNSPKYKEKRKYREKIKTYPTILLDTLCKKINKIKGAKIKCFTRYITSEKLELLAKVEVSEMATIENKMAQTIKK